jgi:hypothetical protein
VGVEVEVSGVVDGTPDDVEVEDSGCDELSYS